MRKLVGGLVLVAGIGGLGVWGANSHADRMETQIRTAAKAVGETTLHNVMVSTSGRDIEVSGLADTESERNRIIAALGKVEGRRVVRDKLVVLPVAEPYNFAVTRKAGRSIMQGNVPSEAMRQALDESGAEGAASLTLASGAPERWETAIGAGVAGLSQMDEGALSAEGSKLRLSGIVETPDVRDAVLASIDLPNGYELTSDIETRDDGKPVDFTLSYQAGTGATVAGKLPAGLEFDVMAKALGVSSVSGDAKSGKKGSADAALIAMTKLSAWLPEMETVNLRIAEQNVSVAGQVLPGAASDLIERAMQSEFEDGAMVELSEMTTLPASGATRTNAATGEAEVFTNGFWLPNIAFTPSLQTCTTQSEQVLKRAKINFLSGSTQLGPRSIRSINAVASVVRRCVNEAGLRAEIGGHTDNTGSGNFPLSADRAVVVRNAMIARGVSQDALTAAGYGASKPIADNATEEGRAANRRTTIKWTR